MTKIMYTRPDDGGLSIVISMPKECIEKELGPLTDEEYLAHIWARGVPEDAINPRHVTDDAIPADREFRNAWVDVTEEAQVDIDCTKAKEIQLTKLREERDAAFPALDREFMMALEKGADVSDIVARKQALRDVTDLLKDLDTAGKVNCEETLQTIRELGTL